MSALNLRRNQSLALPLSKWNVQTQPQGWYYHPAKNSLWEKTQQHGYNMAAYHSTPDNWDSMVQAHWKTPHYNQTGKSHNRMLRSQDHIDRQGYLQQPDVQCRPMPPAEINMLLMTIETQSQP